jgi:hypothetical protein
MSRSEVLKDELIIKIDSSSIISLDKFIELLRSNNLDVKAIGHDEYLIKL